MSSRAGRRRSGPGHQGRHEAAGVAERGRGRGSHRGSVSRVSTVGVSRLRSRYLSLSLFTHSSWELSPEGSWGWCAGPGPLARVPDPPGSLRASATSPSCPQVPCPTGDRPGGRDTHGCHRSAFGICTARARVRPRREPPASGPDLRHHPLVSGFVMKQPPLTVPGAPVARCQASALSRELPARAGTMRTQDTRRHGDSRQPSSSAWREGVGNGALAAAGGEPCSVPRSRPPRPPWTPPPTSSSHVRPISAVLQSRA